MVLMMRNCVDIRHSKLAVFSIALMGPRVCMCVGS